MPPTLIITIVFAGVKFSILNNKAASFIGINTTEEAALLLLHIILQALPFPDEQYATSQRITD
jgi:hypothetical protein